jgi:hypothetical protein
MYHSLLVPIECVDDCFDHTHIHLSLREFLQHVHIQHFLIQHCFLAHRQSLESYLSCVMVLCVHSQYVVIHACANCIIHV